MIFKYFGILGGGGVRGISYVGALKALREKNIVLTGLAGSSVGAVFASLVAVGYTPEELEQITLELDFKLFSDLHFGLGKTLAFSKGGLFFDWLKNLIEVKFKENNPDFKKDVVTFEDIEDDLIIISTNLTNSTFKEFSKYTTPDFEIAQAVRISITLPGLFMPISVDDELLVDGDLHKSLPMWQLSPNLNPADTRILEFRIEGNKLNPKISNSIDYINSVFSTISNIATDNIIKEYNQKDKFDYIKINAGEIFPINFSIPPSAKYKLMSIGYETTKEYFENSIVTKKRHLSKIYEELLKLFLKMKFFISKGEILEAKNVFSEIIFYAYENKLSLDDSLEKFLIEFKKMFFENIENSKFFSKVVLKNKSLINNKLEYIEEELTSKSEDLKYYIEVLSS